MRGQGFIGSDSPSYVCKLWRHKFTSGDRKAPHVVCRFCPEFSNSGDNQDVSEQAGEAYICPVCGVNPSTWNSLRSHIQKKHQNSAKSILEEFKSKVSCAIISCIFIDELFRIQPRPKKSV